MTAPAFMAFGGPAAGAWLPLGDSPVRYELELVEVPDDVLDALAAAPVASPAPRPLEHRYDLARFAWRNPDDGAELIVAGWLYAPEHAELAAEIVAWLKVIAWLAGYRPVWRLLPRSA